MFTRCQEKENAFIIVLQIAMVFDMVNQVKNYQESLASILNDETIGGID